MQARRLAERQDADGIVGDLVMDALAGTAPLGLMRRLVTALPRRVRDTLRSRSDDVLAELLTDPNAMQGLQRALDRLDGRGVPSIARGQGATTATNAGVLGGLQ